MAKLSGAKSGAAEQAEYCNVQWGRVMTCVALPSKAGIAEYSSAVTSLAKQAECSQAQWCQVQKSSAKQAECSEA